MTKDTFSDYTREEFRQFLYDIMHCSSKTDKECEDALEAFIRLTEHPEASDLMCYPVGGKECVDHILQEITDWRSRNNKPLFRS